MNNIIVQRLGYSTITPIRMIGPSVFGTGNKTVSHYRIVHNYMINGRKLQPAKYLVNVTLII